MEKLIGLSEDVLDAVVGGECLLGIVNPVTGQCIYDGSVA